MTKFGSVIVKPNRYFLKITFWKAPILPNGSSVIILYEFAFGSVICKWSRDSSGTSQAGHVALKNNANVNGVWFLSVNHA